MIGVGEETAGEQRNLHGLEVAGAHPAEVGDGPRVERTCIAEGGDHVPPAIAVKRKHADDAGGADAWQLAEPFERALIEGFAGSLRAVLLVRQDNAGADDMLGGEAAIDAQQMIEAEQKHASENNERDAGCDFCDDERAAQSLAARRFARGAAFGTQRLLGMIAHEACGGQQAAEQCREERCANGEEDDLRVHTQRMQQRQRGGQRVREVGERESGEGEAEQTSAGTENAVVQR